MELNDLKDQLLQFDSGTELCIFIRNNKQDIEQFFLSWSPSYISENKYELHDLFFDFTDTIAFKQAEQANEAEAIELLSLFAEGFEKVGFRDVISSIKSYFPKKSSIRKRLEAVLEFSSISNPQTDYISMFDLVLSKLKDAQEFGEEDYTGKIIQDALHYYKSATDALTNYQSELDTFKALFSSPNSTQSYPFLRLPAIQEVISGVVSVELFVETIAQKVYEPSELAYSVFNQLIIKPITRAGYLKRYDNNEIRGNVLEYGRADFNVPYKDLSPYDRVQLYCYFNMRKHYFTTYAILEKIGGFIEANLIKGNKRLLFIDIGCGPLTSGLAISDLLRSIKGESIPINYIGIDIANSMLQKAKEFSQTELFHESSSFHFFPSWNNINDSLLNELLIDDTILIVNTSYLFASNSLDEHDLALFINRLQDAIITKSYLIFQNADSMEKSLKYICFKEKITHNIIHSHKEEIRYRNKPNSFYEPSSERVYYEILKS